MEGRPPLSLSRAKPGGHELPRERVVHHQRERMLDAALALVSERGYRAVTVADIVRRAATSRAKFYENFSSKPDCFLAAVERALEGAQAVAEGALAAAEGSPAERFAAAVEALLDYLAERPAIPRACLLEAPLLGSDLDPLRERAREASASLLREAFAPPAEPDAAPADPDAVLAGLYWILYNALLSGEADADLRRLAPELTEFARLSYPEQHG